MNMLSLAARNVMRNGHRSLVTTLAMAFACAMMIVFSSLMEGLVVGSERNIVSMNTGDIQIHQRSYRDEPDIYKQINQSLELVTAIRQAGFMASERLFAYGLMASDQSSSGVQLRGVDLDYEATVTQINQHIQTGDWLDKSDSHGVVIGKKLARLLDVSIGSELIFIGQTADGYMANDRFYIRGILKSVSARMDSSGVIMSNAMLQELINLSDGAHEIAIMRSDRNTDLALAVEIIDDLVADDLEILNWHQLMPVISQFLQTAHVQSLIMLVFTYIAVASVVLNAMLMSVFERIHEFGIMKAVGVRPWQLIRIIYAETFIQTLLASLLGLLFGVSITWYFEQNGLDLSSLSESISFAGLALDPVWYAALSMKSLFAPVLFLFVIAAVAVIYPALKAAVIRPVDAIYHH
jgi:ABC-type lipoprotein release transport system permease subunit